MKRKELKKEGKTEEIYITMARKEEEEKETKERRTKDKNENEGDK